MVEEGPVVVIQNHDWNKDEEEIELKDGDVSLEIYYMETCEIVDSPLLEEKKSKFVKGKSPQNKKRLTPASASASRSPEKRLTTSKSQPLLEPEKPYWVYNDNSNWKRFRDEIIQALETTLNDNLMQVTLKNVLAENDEWVFNFADYTFKCANLGPYKFQRKAADPPAPMYIPTGPPMQKKGFSFFDNLSSKVSELVINRKKKPLATSSPVFTNNTDLQTNDRKTPKKSPTKLSNSQTDDFLENIRKTLQIPPSFDFTKIPLPKLRKEGPPELRRIYDSIHACILSPESLTETENVENEKVKEKTSEELLEILKQNVENIDSIFDRSGATPVSQFIVSTYTQGLPLFKGNTVVQNHTIHAMKMIFDKVPQLPESTRKAMFKRLAEAYTACQMEQGRVIDSLYGTVTGRDKSFKAQICALIDVQKEQVMNQMINFYNPEAWKTSDDNPTGQIPHIQSSYCIALSGRLGLRGLKAALLDKDVFKVHPTNIEVLQECFKRMFLIQDLINTIVNDINQQSPEADRILDNESLAKWAGDANINNGFDSYSIFYDEEHAEAWPKELGVPLPENQYKPFLNHTSALRILEHLFLK